MSNLKGAKICLETYDLKPNYSELARIYHIDRRTAKKRFNGITNKETKEKISKLDKYIDVIKDKLKIPGTTMKSVYKYIEMNIDVDIGSYSNFRKYVNKNEEFIKIKDEAAHVLFETDFGIQLQFDWKGPIRMHLKDSTVITFYIFSATLSASRFHIYIYSKFMTREAVQNCLIETFRIIGGTTKEAITDNMSTIVNYSQHDFVPEFKAFAKDFNLELYHCKVDHPFTKGKDESCNRFVNWLLPYEHELNDENELIEVIKRLNNEINKEVNQTTNMPPVTLFQQEKEYLQPLPSETIIESYLDTLVPVKVSNTMLFYYKGCRYSVPKKYINQTVKVKEVDNKLFIYYNKNLITTHDITYQKINYHHDDYVEGLSSAIYNKSEDEIEKLAENNLKLLEKFNK